MAVPQRLREWRRGEWESVHDWSAARQAFVQEHGDGTELGDELDAICGAAQVIVCGEL